MTVRRHLPWCAEALAVAISMAGCSLVNAPDRDRITDGGPADAPFDAPDAPPDGGPHPEVCDDPARADEDRDGLANCADFDCAALPICCTGTDGATYVDTGWTTNWEADWFATIVTEEGAEWPTSASMSGEHRLISFGLPESPGGVVSQTCVPLTLGLRVETALTTSNKADDEACARGEAFAAVALSSAQQSELGVRLPSDLSVELTACGELRVKAGATTLGAPLQVGAHTKVPLEITITPGAVVDGRPFLSATVEARLGAGKRTLVEARPFIDVASLLDDGACATNGGLYLAVEGQGDGVQASPLSATGLGCANPGQFRTPSGDFGAVTAATPDLPAWSGGGIGSPGVVKTASSLHLFFDATTDPRELDTNGLASLSFAVGHARRGAGGDATWATETPANASRVPGPVPCTIGTNSCGTVSVRDPSPYYGAPENLLAFARERTSGGNPVRGRYAIDVLAMGSDLLNTGTTRNPLATPTYASNACASLRDPAVVPSPPDGADRYWLFFTCIPGIGKPDIRAVRLRKAEEGGFVAMGDEVVVADAESLGPFAGAGVFDPEVLLDADDAEGPLYRLWFLARDTRRTKTSVGLAQWRVRKDEDPAFSTYPGNPVLTDADAVLAPCEGKCALTAWSVTRRDASTLLFGLARTVNRTEDVEYRIEFLEQTWAAPGGGVP